MFYGTTTSQPSAMSPISPRVPRRLRVLTTGEVGEVRGEGFLPGLGDDEISVLESVRTRQTYSRGRTILYEGDGAEHIYHLTGGTVRLTKLLADGRRQVTGFPMAGDFLGLTHCELYPYSAEAIDEVTLHCFERRTFEVLSERSPRLACLLLSRANGELVQAQAQYLLLGRRSPREKLAYFLLHLRERLAAGSEQHKVLRLPMGRADIADYLGMTVETLSRSFTCMRKQGLIELPDPQTVVFKNEDAVEDIAA